MAMRYTEQGLKALSTGCTLLSARERQVMRLAGGSDASQKLLVAMGTEGAQIVNKLLKLGYLLPETKETKPDISLGQAARAFFSSSQFPSTRMDTRFADNPFDHPSPRAAARTTAPAEPMLTLRFGHDPEDELDFNSEVFALQADDAAADASPTALADSVTIRAADLEKARKHLVTVLGTQPDLQSQKLAQQILLNTEGELALDCIMRAVEHYSTISSRECTVRLRGHLATVLPPQYAPLMELGQ